MTGETRPTRSVRLTFAYDDDGLRLADRTPRRGAAPPTAPLDRDPPPAAVVVEVRAEGGGPLYRTLLADPIPQSLEARDDEGNLRRHEHAARRGAFTAVVPAPAEATVLVVSAGPAVKLAQPALAGRRELLRERLG
jgi:hypothetical protein